MGLREWTVELEPEALSALHDRLAAAGIAVEDGVVADPSGIRVRFA